MTKWVLLGIAAAFVLGCGGSTDAGSTTGSSGGASVVPYEHAETYDILPASEGGAYFAAGVRIGSTLASDGTTHALERPSVAPPGPRQ